MFHHPYVIEMLAEQRREEFMAEAELWRMLEKSLEPSLKSASLPDRLLLGLAGYLIRAGEMIQGAYSSRRMERENCETC